MKRSSPYDLSEFLLPRRALRTTQAIYAWADTYERYLSRYSFAVSAQGLTGHDVFTYKDYPAVAAEARAGANNARVQLLQIAWMQSDIPERAKLVDLIDARYPAVPLELEPQALLSVTNLA